MNRLLFLSICLLSVAGCDRTLNFKYIVVNNTDFSIDVAVQVSTTDTVFTINPADSALIYTDQRIGKEVMDYTGTEMYIFSKLEMYKTANESIKINKDIYKRQYWTFEADETEGRYRLAVTNADFM